MQLIIITKKHGCPINQAEVLIREQYLIQRGAMLVLFFIDALKTTLSFVVEHSGCNTGRCGIYG